MNDTLAYEQQRITVCPLFDKASCSCSQNNDTHVTRSSETWISIQKNTQ
jgi:hypothetical protein